MDDILKKLAIFKSYSEISYQLIIKSCEDYFKYGRQFIRKHNCPNETSLPDEEILLNKFMQARQFFLGEQYDLFLSSAALCNMNADISGITIIRHLNKMIEDTETYPNDDITLD